MGGTDVGPDDAPSWLEMARTLLSPDRISMTLDEEPPDPAPGQIGALAGFGCSLRDRDLHVRAYVFGYWGGGHEPAEALKAEAEAAGRTAFALVTGQLLFFATAGPDIDDKVGLYQLSRALSGSGAI